MKADVKDKIKCFLLLAGYIPAFDFFFVEDNTDYQIITHFTFLILNSIEKAHVLARGGGSVC
jgi:hypothetical protein